ncbi:acetoacetyl-CoA synthetase-like protein [Eremomyces bilateralis CBS 781.70]|uniref:Acetoacetyl-CoA synthetase-like protein n=1 Tax=Eremomyces bilateralis CBS 781.70 TaxID=1392243 RepID=A0A6G1G9X6_9PEZI|nr:acetoacetyl-CoA synthetase-like protein [Eremomyces bilateralis CBS 781.70]KAF1814878.1 acetoacetyl-CoA synthetase-like protein [Eremomyces bilateralis CBS 781.70]
MTDNDAEGLTPLWEHNDPSSTNMYRFMERVNEKHGLNFKTYKELYAWSVTDLPTFWEEVWHFTGIKASTPYEKVLDASAPMFPPPAFFEGAHLNFAENLLFPPSNPPADDVAVFEVTEIDRRTVSWGQLRERVRECQSALQHGLGVRPGDRVAGFVGNHANTLVAALASISLGAIWTAVSPDFGVQGVLERLRQIEPTVLFADSASFYNGKVHPALPKVAEIAADLPSLKAAVIFRSISGLDVDISSVKVLYGEVLTYNDFLQRSRPSELIFEQLPPNHPIYILYSSGTTGAPKCICHGAIGTLIQHKKELFIHGDVGPGSRILYYTTTAWMMWHWLVTSLASGAALVLYDGSPFRSRAVLAKESINGNPVLEQEDATPTSIPDDYAMAKLISELKITHFGTSAKYLSLLEQKQLDPRSHPSLDLTSLQAIYSTGSPLPPSTFRYIYRVFPPSLNLASITGGTDIVSLFGAPNPLLAVYPGEIQAPGLGMAIRAFEPDRTDVTDRGTEGDLVCTAPFPCQPVGFWARDADGSSGIHTATGIAKYRAAYFELFPGVWHHGDFVRFNPRTGPGLVMLGRSDGVLKPAGVRFGSAEIYNVVLKGFGSEVADALCIGRRRAEDADEEVVLFLKMEKGKQLDEGLRERVKRTIRGELSARHVPAIVDECVEIPVTTNGKKIEGAVKQILSGMNIKLSASVSNPECLEFYREWARTH